MCLFAVSMLQLLTSCCLKGYKEQEVMRSNETLAVFVLEGFIFALEVYACVFIEVCTCQNYWHKSPRVNAFLKGG